MRVIPHSPTGLLLHPRIGTECILLSLYCVARQESALISVVEDPDGKLLTLIKDLKTFQKHYIAAVPTAK